MNIALDTWAFRDRWTSNHQVNCWVTKGVPIPPKIKVDHNIQLCSSTSYFLTQSSKLQLYKWEFSIKLCPSTFTFTDEHCSRSGWINVGQPLSALLSIHALFAKDELWITKLVVELPKAYQSRHINRSWDFNFRRVERSTSNVTYQHETSAINIGIDHKDN